MLFKSGPAFEPKRARRAKARLSGFGALSVLIAFGAVACSHQYDGATSPLNSKLILISPPVDVSLGEGFDSNAKRLTQFGCVTGTPVGRFRNSKTDALAPVSTISVNPTRDSLYAALTNLSRISGWLNNSAEIHDFAAASAGKKTVTTSTRLVVVDGEIFTLGKDRMRNFMASHCADAFVSHLYAGAIFGVTIAIEFKSSRARADFAEKYGASAPFGPGDRSDRYAEMGQDLASSSQGLTVTVIQMGGDADQTAGLLNQSRCNVNDLQSCADTLADLVSKFSQSLSFPESESRLNGFAITDFATSDYKTLE